MRLLLLSFVFLLAPLAAAAQPLLLAPVELHEDASGAWLSMSTDRPANFTSFKLDAPLRIVVDFAETITVPVTRQVAGKGPVRGWFSRTMGDADAPVTRLVVELRRDADYTLVADGTLLVLRLRPATGRPLVALDGERRLPAVAPEPAVVSEPAVVLEPEVSTPSVVAQPFDELPRLAEPPAPVRREPEVASPPVVARLPVEPPAPEPEVRSPPSVARVPSAPASLPVVALAPPPAELPRARPSVERPARSQRPDRRSALASLDQVSFRRTSDGARIVLRTSRPVAWALVEGAPDVVYLELEDTHIPATPNRLPLDPRYFGTAVIRVVPREERAAGSTRVAVELGAPARWSAFADGADVVLEVVGKGRSALAGGESW